MTPVLVYDTETAGFPLYSKPSEDPRQPHIVQLAGALVDMDTRSIVSSMDVIIKPDGWTIPDEVSAIHGITTEMANDLGIAETSAVSMFLELWQGGRPRIGHNESFDARIVRIALKRFPDVFAADIADKWKDGPAECTARLSTPIVKCPPTAKMLAVGRTHHKNPNLGEAYEFFTGEKLQNAHSAMADVLGCIAVYFGVKDYAPAMA